MTKEMGNPSQNGRFDIQGHTRGENLLGRQMLLCSTLGGSCMWVDRWAQEER